MDRSIMRVEALRSQMAEIGNAACTIIFSNSGVNGEWGFAEIP